ncbi:MAG: regulatory protein RecX [Lachnospiraceae bacterium]|nr:regulatory protein RecX [Lachnospiraceae bacterium]
MTGYITDIISVNRTKNRIIIDKEGSFVLYKKECEAFGLSVDSELNDEVYGEIFLLLRQRALKYAVHLLEARDRTEGQLLDKLYSAGYPKDVAEYVIEKLQGYRYINDKNFADNFIRNNIGIMSMREIENKLYDKKVPDDIVKELVSQYKDDNADSEEEAFRYLLNKKKVDIKSLDIKGKQRLTAFFMRKGFSYDFVRKHLKIEDEDITY